MTELLTAAQMRAIETAAIESGEVTGLELMERAGRGVVDAIFEEWPELAKTSHRAVVLCGPGNNGGDGFVVARLLKEWGWEVEVFLYGDADKLPPDAKVNYKRWLQFGKVAPLEQRCVDEAGLDVLVDALFGTGLTRGVDIDFSRLFTHGLLSGSGWKTVAVDLPSGLCSDSGKSLGRVISADLTVSFQTEKCGHRLQGESGRCGVIRVVDIGIGAYLDDPIRIEVLMSEPVREAHCRSKWMEKPSAHKFFHGHALILSGGTGKTGAARLAARGALRIGAGVVTLGVAPAAQMEVAGHITAVMLQRIEDGDALTSVLEDRRINALCLGPGMGVDDRGRALINAVLFTAGDEPRVTETRSVVLDADALTLLAQDEVLFGMLHEHCVLTPHAGEFARMFPDIAEKLNASPTKGPAYSKVDATREAAKRAGCVVLFKGPDTVIAAPDGRCCINSAQYERAAPWLATAGSGDVLAGFITGLLARGFAPMQAAETAAWLHVECARIFGPGLIAEDLPEMLPKVFQNLGL